MFERDAGTGTLTALETKKHGWVGVDGLDGASGVIVSPDGVNVYVTSENDSSATVFRQICSGAPAVRLATCGDALDEGPNHVTARISVARTA